MAATTIGRLLEPYVGQEFASEALAEWTYATGSAWRELRHPSRIVTERSELGWRTGEIYERILETDTDAAGLWDKRLKAVLRLPRWVRPADSSPRARETAEFVRAALGLIPQRIINLNHDLGQIIKGVSVSELMWERVSRGPLAGAWLTVDQIDRPMWRFAWSHSNRQLHVRRRAGEPVPAPFGKFLVGTFGTKDNPYGRALLDWVYWFWYIKKHASKYWAVYVERFAQPLPRGTYKHRMGGGPDAEAHNAELQELLLKAIDDIRTGTGIVHPEGTLLEFMEASRGGDSTYSSFISWLTRGEALLLLGEVDTSGMGKGPGSFAKSQVSNEVRLETVAHDADVLSTYHTDTLSKLLVSINFGPDWPVPHIVYDAMDASDRENRAKGIDRALANDEPVPRSYARMTWQIPEIREGEETIAPRRNEPAKASFSAVRLTADDFSDIGATVERFDQDLLAIATFQEETLDYFAAQREQLAGLFEANPQDPAILSRLISSSRPDLHAEVLETAQIHAAGLAMLDLAELSGPLPIQLTIPSDALSHRTPATALEFWLRLLSIPKELFRELLDAFRKVAFSVAGLTQASVLVEAHELVARALAEGMDRATFERELEELYGRKGLTPTSPWHAALIYTNNVRQAAALVRYQQTVGNPAAHRLIPYLLWWTIDDEKVRDGRRPHQNHAVVHGLIFAIGHEFWRTWWPIAGHGCRCGIGTINVAEARRRGLTGAEPTGPWPLNPATGDRALPDPGFRGRPDLDFVASDAVARARSLVESASGNAGLLEALRSLFNALGLAAEIFGGNS